MNKNKKIKVALTVGLCLALLGVIVFALAAFADLKRESDYIAAQPGSSGVDFLGLHIASAMVVIITFMLAVIAVDIYISLWYFLVSAVKRRVKTVMNAAAFTLSLISLFFVALVFVFETGVGSDLFILGFFWALALPIYRLVYCFVNIGKG